MPSRKRKQVRGEPLVENVIEAALEELSAKGYEGFSIELVAERAAVNKTTIYRRWPAKADLARAALERVADSFDVVDDLGSIRADLGAFLEGLRNFASSPRGQTLFRMLIADEPEIVRLAQSLRRAKECMRFEVVGRAIARGELPPGTDAPLLFNILVSTLQHEILFVRGKVDDRWIARLVDLVVSGAANVRPPRRRRPARPSTRKK